jgi:hypothetical protein
VRLPGNWAGWRKAYQAVTIAVCQAGRLSRSYHLVTSRAVRPVGIRRFVSSNGRQSALVSQGKLPLHPLEGVG